MSKFTFINETTGAAAGSDGLPYDGPVAGIENCFILPEAGDSYTIIAGAAAGPSFISLVGKADSGIDTSAAAGGNILDGAFGSSFLIGTASPAALPDIFYLNANSALTQNLWSTVENFHTGDQITIWDFPGQAFAMTWMDGKGAPGATGLTGVYTNSAGMLSAITIAGWSKADLASGKLSLSIGSTPYMSGASMGTSYLHIGAGPGA
jgi:hypothetical protein